MKDIYEQIKLEICEKRRDLNFDVKILSKLNDIEQEKIHKLLMEAYKNGDMRAKKYLEYLDKYDICY